MYISSYIQEIGMARKIAVFGTDGIMGDIYTEENLKNRARLLSLYRWIKIEQAFIFDTKFAIASGNIDKNKFFELLKPLKGLEHLYQFTKEEITSITPHGETKTIHINQKVFDFCINQMNEIHDQILSVLNKNNLIFRGADEYDVYEYKQNVLQRIAETI
jgi:hypothetical protein